MIRKTAYTFILILTSFLFLVGCDGTAGPDGEDAPPIDIVAPQLEIVRPQAGESIYSSLMTIEAELFQEDDEDDQSLDRVRFIVNGLDQIGNDSAVVSQPPYVIEWDLDQSGFDFGPITIVAEGVDTLGNISRTALRTVTYRQLAGIDTLVDTNGPGTSSSMTLPAKLIDGLDTTWVNQMATRFRPLERGILHAIRILPVQRANSYPKMADFWVKVYAVSDTDTLQPGLALDSTFVRPDPFLHDRWQTINLWFMNQEALSFEAGEAFFVGIQPVVELSDTLDTGLSVGSLLEADTSAVQAEESLYWYEMRAENPLWVPVSTYQLQRHIQHLHLEAVIGYQPEGANP